MITRDDMIDAVTDDFQKKEKTITVELHRSAATCVPHSVALEDKSIDGIKDALRTTVMRQLYGDVRDELANVIIEIRRSWTPGGLTDAVLERLTALLAQVS